MIKQHTARSLARYLGMEVRVNSFNEQLFQNSKEVLAGILSSPDHFSLEYDHGFYSLEEHDIYPILKDHTQLTDEDVRKAYGWSCLKDFIQEDFGKASSKISLKAATILINCSYGAIKDKESPTGYVDLWGYPCVLKEKE